MALKTRNFLYMLGILLLVVLPTAATLGWHEVTQNPNLRPLGVTRQSLDAYERSQGKGGVQIVAQVAWAPANTGGFTKKQLEKAIVSAFSVKGVDVWVFFHDGVGQTTVTYQVGSSSMGPYSAKRAGQGIRAAVDAYHMYVPAES